MKKMKNIKESESKDLGLNLWPHLGAGSLVEHLLELEIFMVFYLVIYQRR